MPSRVASALGRIGTSYALFAVVGVVVGLVLAPIAFGVGAPAPDGTVAVIPLDGTIDGNSSSDVVDMLERARSDPDVEAIVLVSNSGGGAATASETLYLEVERTAAEKPFVASVDATAASGAYYAIAPSDYVYAKPSSVVGSVGVLATVPRSLEPNEVVATSGPNKLAGADEREFYAILETNRRAFVGAVFSHRGENLSLSRTELSEARVYSGARAAQLGLVDEVGGRTAAVRKAARMADLSSYRVREMRPAGESRFLSRNNYLASSAPPSQKRMVGARYLLGNRSEWGTGPPTMLMVPASYVASGGETADDARGATNATASADGTNDSADESERREVAA
jgi:protease-4